MKTKYLFRTPIIFVVFLVGCQTPPQLTNISPLLLHQDPTVSTMADPDVDFTKYRTFTVLPISKLSKKDTLKMNEIVEKQYLFFLRNLFERKGYKFVALKEKPDLIITGFIKSEYKESYVPPRTITVPHYTPGKYITTYGSRSGSFNMNTYGLGSSNTYGNYSGSSTYSTYIPGSRTTKQLTRPGYTVGYHYPTALINAVDAKTRKVVWEGNGVGTSKVSDPRISSQIVTITMTKSFPARPVEEIIAAYKDRGSMGASVHVVTVDGNNYYPMIIGVVDGGAAKNAGIRRFDIVIEANGVSLRNKSLQNIRSTIMVRPGELMHLKVKRLMEVIPINVTLK